MKKKVLFVLILLTIFMCIPSIVLAKTVDIQGCNIIPGAKIDVKIANTVHYIILAIFFCFFSFCHAFQAKNSQFYQK